MDAETEQVSGWISIHGDARKALGVALPRLGAIRIELDEANTRIATLEAGAERQQKVVNAAILLRSTFDDTRDPTDRFWEMLDNLERVVDTRLSELKTALRTTASQPETEAEALTDDEYEDGLSARDFLDIDGIRSEQADKG